MRCIILISTLFLFATFCSAQEPQWELIDNTHQMYSFAVDPNDENIIYIGRHWVFYKTIDGGATWDTVGTGLNLPVRSIIVDDENPNILWAGGYGGPMGIAKSIDGGLNWVQSDSGLLPFGHHGYETEELYIDRERNILYERDPGAGVRRSTDGGAYWRAISSGIPGGNDLTIDDDGTLYFASDGVYKKELNSDTWVPVRNGLPQNQFGYRKVIQVAAVHGSNTLYCIADTVDNGTVSRLYKSINNGDNWVALDLIVPLPKEIIVINSDTNFVGIASELSNFKTSVLGGVRLSYDGGVSWELATNGLPGPPPLMSAYNMSYDSREDKIYAYLELIYPDSSKRGLFKLSAKTPTSIREVYGSTQSFTLHQNYPNPFNSSTIIQYKLSSLEKTKLTIYDIQGKEVITLVNQKQQPGSYSLQWNGQNSGNRNVSGGIYFYRLTTGREVTTRKMVYIP
jgi:Secretion system C-terminal sorting domain